MSAETQVVLTLKDRMSAAMRKATGASKRFQSSLGKLNASMTTLSRSVAGLGVAFASFKIGESFIEANKSIEQTFYQLKAVTGSVSEAKEGMSYIQNFALKNPVQSLATFNKMFVKLRANGIDPTTGAMQTLTDSAAALGLSSEQMDGVILAVGQIAANGRFAKEEFMQLAERIPGLGAIIEKGMGKPLEKIFKDMTKGLVSSKAGLEGLFDGLRDKFQGSSQDMENTFVSSMNRLKLAWELFMQKLNQNGLFQDMANGMKSIADYLIKNGDHLAKIFGVVWDMAMDIGRSFTSVFSGSGFKSFAKTLMEVTIFFQRGISIGIQFMSSWIKLFASWFDSLLAKVWNAFTKIQNKFMPSEAASKLKNKASEEREWIRKLAKHENMEPVMKNGRYVANNSRLQEELDERQDNLRAIETRLQMLEGKEKNSILGFDHTNLEDEQRKFGDALLLQLDNEKEWRQRLEKAFDGMSDFKIPRKPELPSSAGESGKTANKADKTGPAITLIDDKSKSLLQNTQAINDELDKLFGTHEAPPTFFDGFADQMTALKQKTELVFADMHGLGVRFADSLAAAMSSSLETAFFDVIEGRAVALEDILNNFFESIAKSMARIAADNITNSILGSVFGASGGGASPFSALFGGFRANGGPVTAGTSYIVGERGPELFTPGVSGGITPNSATGSMRVEIINNSSQALEVEEANGYQDIGGQILQFVVGGLSINKNGSRDSLRAMLA